MNGFFDFLKASLHKEALRSQAINDKSLSVLISVLVRMRSLTNKNLLLGYSSIFVNFYNITGNS